MNAVIVLFGAIALAVWGLASYVSRRPRKCTHPGVVFVRSSGMQECPTCGRIVEWHEVQR